MMLAKTAAQSRAVRPGDGMPSIAPAVSFTYKTLCLAHSVQMPFVRMSPCRLEHRTRHPGRALGSSPECELGQKKRKKTPQDRLGAGIQPTWCLSRGMIDTGGIKVPLDTSPIPAQATP